MSRFAQIWRTRLWFIERLWWHVEVCEGAIVDDLSGFCTSRAIGSSGNTISLKWSLDLYEYEGVGCDPLKLLVGRGSVWSNIWTWIFQVRWIKGRRRFLWVEFCELLSKFLEIRKRRRQALLNLLPFKSTLWFWQFLTSRADWLNQQVSLTVFKVELNFLWLWVYLSCKVWL